MKIQGARAEGVSATSQMHASERSRSNGTRAASSGAGAAPDRFEVSSDARLADYAIKAAADLPEIRLDVVEKARQRLSLGQLGADVERLASRMIDAMLQGA